MAVVVSFVTPKGIGSVHAPGVGAVRTMEVVATDSASTAVAQDGEVAVVVNGETTVMLVAFGTTPDGDAAASTAATSAGVPVAAGQSIMLVTKPGDKVGVGAVPSAE